jgi:hypothetical protein
MYVIFLVIAYAAACWKWGDWKRWREFYPTILYMVIANLTCAYVFYEYRLWIFKSFMGDSVTCLVIKDFISPSAIILFLTHYPKGAFKQTIYILAWAAVNTVLESVAYLLNGITYDHGWSLLCSFLLLVIAFALARLHYRRPLLAWLPSLAAGAATALVFGLPYPR